MSWNKIGVIGVDAGLCYIGDPCYFIKNKEFPGEETEFEQQGLDDWPKFVSFCYDNTKSTEPVKQQFNYLMGHAGLGVCVSSGFGDGSYDVLANIEDMGIDGKRIKAIKIVFIPEGNDD
jgi:hypothetical protein